MLVEFKWLSVPLHLVYMWSLCFDKEGSSDIMICRVNLCLQASIVVECPSSFGVVTLLG